MLATGRSRMQWEAELLGQQLLFPGGTSGGKFKHSEIGWKCPIFRL